MEAKDILEHLIDSKILSIIRIFFENDKRPFYLREISKLTGVSPASTFRLLNKLKTLNVIEQETITKFKIYRLSDNEITRFLGQLVKKQKQILQVFVTRAKAIEGLKDIILYGEEGKEESNLLVIGYGIKNDAINDVCKSIKEEFNYNIKPLILTREQFEQMVSMNLYSEKKRVIFSVESSI